MAVRHHILDQLFGGILISVFLLPLGAGRHRAGTGHRACAADHPHLFQQDHAVAILSRLQRRRKTRRARADDDHIRVHLDVFQFGSCNGRRHLVHIRARLRQRIRHRRFERFRRHRRARNGIHADRLIYKHRFHQLRQCRRADALGFAMLQNVDCGDLLRINRHAQLHVAVKALRCRFIGAGGHALRHRRTTDAAQKQHGRQKSRYFLFHTSFLLFHLPCRRSSTIRPSSIIAQ